MEKIVAKTFDEFAFKLDQKPRLQSSLVDGLSKQAPQCGTSYDLIERVKLINCAVMKSKSDELKLKLLPDLFSITLITMISEKTGLDQKRLLLD